MAELADAIVATGRATLEAAIAQVNGTPEWGARVVYGDTDSLFVLLKGRSKAEAFRIGAEIAAAVTATNPRPVTLKFDKAGLEGQGVGPTAPVLRQASLQLHASAVMLHPITLTPTSPPLLTRAAPPPHS